MARSRKARGTKKELTPTLSLGRKSYGYAEAYSHPGYRQRLLELLKRTVVEEEL